MSTTTNTATKPANRRQTAAKPTAPATKSTPVVELTPREEFDALGRRLEASIRKHRVDKARAEEKVAGINNLIEDDVDALRRAKPDSELLKEFPIEATPVAEIEPVDAEPAAATTVVATQPAPAPKGKAHGFWHYLSTNTDKEGTTYRRIAIGVLLGVIAGFVLITVLMPVLTSWGAGFLAPFLPLITLAVVVIGGIAGHSIATKKHKEDLAGEHNTH